MDNPRVGDSMKSRNVNVTVKKVRVRGNLLELEVQDEFGNEWETFLVVSCDE